jgi:glycosyltransferase involved in cell wall biosynthesis
MENKDAADYLIKNWWPEIQQKYPGSQLRIVGKHAPKAQYFVGEVDRIQDELNAADVLLAPIRIGGGTKYKILEAMASGLPVITTKRGIEGMNGKNEEQFLLAESGHEVVLLLEQLSNQKKRIALSKNARTLVEEEYSWDTIAKLLDNVWNSR